MKPGASIAAVRQTIEAGFPDLWLPIEAALATVLAMVPEDVVNCPTCIFTGPASGGKTTVLDAVGELQGITYRSDNFTPHSFVSHASTVKRDKLPETDMLPRIRHCAMVTPELAPLFRGREEVLTERFGILTAVLDGHGYISDSGTQGRRGYTGDYLFAWLGATTPLPTPVWKIMAALGSRLFFYAMPETPVTDEALLGALADPPYRQRLADCRDAIAAFLPRRLAEYGGVRGVKWDASQDPPEVRRRLASLARLVARLRGITSVWQERDGEDFGYTPPNIEHPHRAFACLYNLTRGRALVHGRRHLLPEDLALVTHVALSSGPYERTRLVRALAREGGRLTTRLRSVPILVEMQGRTFRR
jgi:hypothetical protein